MTLDVVIEPGGPGDRLLSWGMVKEITGLSRTTAWRRQKAGDFPLAVQITPGRVGWWQSELDAWKASRAPRSVSRAAPPAAPAAEERRLPSLEAEAAPRPAPPARLRAQPPREKRACEGQIAFEF